MVLNYGSGHIKARQGKEYHAPDAYFACCLANPIRGVAVEVAYSQGRDKLPRLAEFYLFQSKRMCQMVIGIDCNYYGGTKKATLLVYRRDGSDPAGKKIILHAQVSKLTPPLLSNH